MFESISELSQLYKVHVIIRQHIIIIIDQVVYNLSISSNSRMWTSFLSIDLSTNAIFSFSKLSTSFNYSTFEDVYNLFAKALPFPSIYLEFSLPPKGSGKRLSSSSFSLLAVSTKLLNSKSRD